MADNNNNDSIINGEFFDNTEFPPLKTPPTPSANDIAHLHTIITYLAKHKSKSDARVAELTAELTKLRAEKDAEIQRLGLIEFDEKKGEMDVYDIPPCKLMVRTLNKMDANERWVLTFNFHLVDLQNKQIKWNYIPAIPMMKGASMGHMAMLKSKSDSCIYILSPTKSKYEEDENDDDDDDKFHIHCASSKYSSVSERWYAFDDPFETNGWPIPATISNKLYCFKYQWGRPKVYENGWKVLDLPDHLIHRKVSLPIIPDRKNNRYLVHFSDSGEIYAFPSLKTDSSSSSAPVEGWTCVVDNFSNQWIPPVAVSGNILFFHAHMLPYLIIAYDMSTNKWLEVDGDFTRVPETLSYFRDMFTLPENHQVLCLVTGLPGTPNDPASINILMLGFNHTIGSNHLKLTALNSQCYDIVNPFSTFYDFLVL